MKNLVSTLVRDGGNRLLDRKLRFETWFVLLLIEHDAIRNRFIVRVYATRNAAKRSSSVPNIITTIGTTGSWMVVFSFSENFRIPGNIVSRIRLVTNANSVLVL